MCEQNRENKYTKIESSVIGLLNSWKQYDKVEFDFEKPRGLKEAFMRRWRNPLTRYFSYFGNLYDTAYEQLKDTDCILDLSSAMMFMEPGQPEHYINLYGAERLAFGTDYPVWDPVEEVQQLGAYPKP